MAQVIQVHKPRPISQVLDEGTAVAQTSADYVGSARIPREQFEAVLGGDAVRVWSYLVQLREEHGGPVYPSRETIAQAPGFERLSLHRVEGALERLRLRTLVRDLGFILKQTRRGRFEQRYYREVFGRYAGSFVMLPEDIKTQLLSAQVFKWGGPRKGAGRPKAPAKPAGNPEVKKESSAVGPPKQSSAVVFNIKSLGGAAGEQSRDPGVPRSKKESSAVGGTRVKKESSAVVFQNKSLGISTQQKESSAVVFQNRSLGSAREDGSAQPKESRTVVFQNKSLDGAGTKESRTVRVKESRTVDNRSIFKIPSLNLELTPFPSEKKGARQKAAARLVSNFSKAEPTKGPAQTIPDEFPPIYLPPLISRPTPRDAPPAKPPGRPAGAFSPQTPTPAYPPTLKTPHKPAQALDEVPTFEQILKGDVRWKPRPRMRYGFDGIPYAPVAEDLGYFHPTPPQVPKALNFGEQVAFVVRWYQLAVESRTGKKCTTGLWGNSRGVFEDATHIFVEQGISPGAWTAWSCDTLMDKLPPHGRAKFTPALKYILSTKRLTEMRWQYRDVEGDYCDRRLIIVPEGLDFKTRWRQFEANMLAGWPHPKERVESELNAFFPKGYETEKRECRAAASKKFEEVKRELKAAKRWLWKVPSHGGARGAGNR